MGLDWIAAALELAGAWIVGNKNKWGFIVFIACGLCWIAYIIVNQSTYGLLLAIMPMQVINVRNFIKWSRDK